MLVGLHRHDLVTGTNLDFAAREWNSTLLNAAAIWEQSSRRNWTIGKNARSLVDSKLFLLHELSKAGASVPPYTIRTEIPPGTIREDSFVAKAVNAWEEIAPGNYFNTRKVSLADAHHLELPSRPQGPIFLQQFARHRREIRIFIIRNLSFGVEITSHYEDVPDFRLLDGASAYARIIEASESTVRILKGLMERLGIEYVAADVIVDDDDHEWIVDFNPLGVWDYLEDDFDLCLTGLVADGIIDHVD